MGTPPATAVSGAAAEITRNVTAPTPRLFFRSWFAPDAVEVFAMEFPSSNWRRLILILFHYLNHQCEYRLANKSM
jgi:hypothetical protein